MKNAPSSRTQLFDANGQRKYLTAQERHRLLWSACKSERQARLLIHSLIYTGIRPVEAIRLSKQHIDQDSESLVVESAKKRNGGKKFRAVPLPVGMTRELSKIQTQRGYGHRLWPWCRSTIWRHVKRHMQTAGIIGPYANVRGLRHTFAVHMLSGGAPLDKVAEYMGHEDLNTTAIYTKVIGQEERKMVQKIWANDGVYPLE